MSTNTDLIETNTEVAERMMKEYGILKGSYYYYRYAYLGEKDKMREVNSKMRQEDHE